MRYLFLACTLFLFACQQPSSQVEEEDEAGTINTTSATADIPTEETATSNMPVTEDVSEEDNDPFLGSYVGYFEASQYDSNKDISWANLITIFIDSLPGKNIYGHSVVAGNERPFQGTYSLSTDGKLLTASAKEPGNDRYDGTFNFQLKRDEATINGKWTAFNKLPVWVREYELEKRSFSYDPKLRLPEDDIWTDLYGTYDEETRQFEMVTPNAAKYNASTQNLTKEMVENMYKGDLEVMRNAIYARHGYSFKNRRMRYVFDNKISWYMPFSTDIRKKLTKLELANIALIKRYEEHADTYYDSFGR